MPAIAIQDITIGDHIDCTLYGAVNNSTSVNGKVVQIVTADGLPPTSTAPTDHVNIYPVLPESVQNTIENDYRSYIYYGVLLQDGKIVYIGKPWIIEATLVREDIVTATIVLTNFTDVDAEAVKALLRGNGYVVDSVTIS